MEFSVKAVVCGLVFLLGCFGLHWIMGHNDDQDWQIIQYPTGTIEIRDSAGWYGKWFGKIWTYPRSVQKFYSANEGEGGEADESIRITFADAGEAQLSVMVKYLTPVDMEKRRLFHRDFGGEIRNCNDAIRSEIINIAKATAPLMTSSEHQSARKAEYSQLIQEQLTKGQFKMRRVERTLNDQLDETGKPRMIFATEIELDEKKMPLIAVDSPLNRYGIKIVQFSVTASEYDKSTKDLFEKKKNTLILSEQMKADRQKEIENRLMIVEKGLREKAEAEAIANVDKTKAVIEGQKKTEVAEMQKKEAEVVANRQLEVAKIEKTEQETKANMSLEVAKINRMAAEEDAKRIVTLAKAEQDKIGLAGALTEHDRVLAEIAAKRDIEVADKLSKIQVPANLMIGGSGEKCGSDFQGTLMNMILLKNLGILKDTKEEVHPIVAPVVPTPVKK